MPFIIPTTQYSKFRYLIEKYRHCIDGSSVARCLIGGTAAAILRNDDSEDLSSLESWLKSIETTNQEKDIDSTVLDQIISKLDTYYQPEEEEEDDEEQEVQESDQEPNEDYYSLKRYKSRTTYSNHSYPVHSHQPKRTFVYLSN